MKIREILKLEKDQPVKAIAGTISKVGDFENKGKIGRQCIQIQDDTGIVTVIINGNPGMTQDIVGTTVTLIDKRGATKVIEAGGKKCVCTTVGFYNLEYTSKEQVQETRMETKDDKAQVIIEQSAEAYYRCLRAVYQIDRKIMQEFGKPLPSEIIQSATSSIYICATRDNAQKGVSSLDFKKCIDKAVETQSEYDPDNTPEKQKEEKIENDESKNPF